MKNNNEHQHDHEHVAESHYGQYDLGLKAFVRSMQIAFLIMAVLIIGMLVFFFAFGGFRIVSPQESVLRVRFGKVQMPVLEKGWYWAFPRPVNEFISIPTNPQSFSIAFEAQKNLAQEGGPADQGGPLAPGRDGYLITADANIIHSRWNVVYRIINAKTYYEKVISATAPFTAAVDKKTGPAEENYSGGPLVLMQNLLRNIVIKETATQSVEQILYNNQVYIGKVSQSFTDKIVAMDLGIVIDSVTVGAATPPLKTKTAFDEVSIARQEREKMISEALSYKVQQENSAISDKVLTLAEAENYLKRTVSEIKSETYYFNKINDEYIQNPDTVLVALYNNVLSEVLSNTKDKFILYKSSRGNQEVRLKINPESKDLKKLHNNQK